MKIRCLIVDDEPIICRGLRETIPWDDLDIEIVGTAYDGRQALELIDTLNVDLVLSDIKMPTMDGLELTETIYKNQFPVKVILISGFEEFEYARRALRFGVQDYLLKPVNIDDLVKVVEKVTNTLKSERSDKQKAKLEDFFNKLTSDLPLDVEDINELKQLFAPANYKVFVTQLEYSASLIKDNEKEETFKQKILLEIGNAFARVKIKTFTIRLHPKILVTVCFFQEFPLKDRVNQALQEIVDNWVYSQKVFFGVSQIANEIEKLPGLYRQAFTNLMFKTVTGEQILMNHHLNQRKSNSYPSDYEKQIIDAIFLNEQQKVQKAVDELFEYFSTNGYLLNEMSQMIDEINLMIARKLREIGLSKLDALEQINKKIDFNIFNTVESLKHHSLQLLQELEIEIESKGENKKHWVIEKAKTFIEDHFDEDIKQIDVASHVHVTPNYLSALFNQEINKGFNEYLNELRIERAKHLLKETYNKVYEIADTIGYRDYKYFVAIFKKVTGVTPSEYRSFQVKK